MAGLVTPCVTHDGAVDELQPVRRTDAGAVCEVYSVGRTTLGVVYETSSLCSLPLVGPHAGEGEQCEEVGVAEMKCYELTTTPIPHPPVLLGGEKVEEL